MGNKVRFNLKNVHYAKRTVTAEGRVEFATPVHIPGAVSVAFSAEGDVTPFYADGIKYYVAVANNGYAGDLSVALIPDSFRIDILGETVDATDKVLVENAYTNPSNFALLFEFDGDVKSTRHVLYNCAATRPSIEGETTTQTKEPKPDTLTLSASSLDDGTVKAKTGDETPEAVYNNWYKQVWVPAKPSAEV